jgi:single-strand DNA-binding protein
MTREEQVEPPHHTVALRGRVSSAPVERALPSGDSILTFRVVVDRERSYMSARSRQRSDWVDCVVWGGRAKRSVPRWQVGDVVEVRGELRRRFFRADGESSSRIEVEVLVARRVVSAP